MRTTLRARIFTNQQVRRSDEGNNASKGRNWCIKLKRSFLICEEDVIGKDGNFKGTRSDVLRAVVGRNSRGYITWSCLRFCRCSNTRPFLSWRRASAQAIHPTNVQHLCWHATNSFQHPRDKLAVFSITLISLHPFETLQIWNSLYQRPRLATNHL